MKKLSKLDRIKLEDLVQDNGLTALVRELAEIATEAADEASDPSAWHGAAVMLERTANMPDLNGGLFVV